MGEKTGIEWTDHTFNPWIGCTAVSRACDFCYAKTLVEGRMGHDFAERRRTVPGNWKQPLKWNREAYETRKRRRVFCASLADVFDNQVPQEWRADLFALIRATPMLDWQLLTKRPQNIAKMLPADWRGGYFNVWLGTTCEDQTEANRRIPHLLRVPALVRFLSCEPLLGPIDLSGFDGNEIDWLIAGGESGPGARPSNPQWFRNLRDQCAHFDVSFFFKQWGEWLPGTQYNETCRAADPNEMESRFNCMDWDGEKYEEASSFWADDPGDLAVFRVGKKRAGSLLDGHEHKELPA